MKRILQAILVGALAASPALAADTAMPKGAEPWSERAIVSHLSFERYAADPTLLDELIAHGKRLFSAKFTVPDGAGRPMATQAIVPTKKRRKTPSAFSRTAGMDANSCASCHHEPVIGGSGPFTANVFVSEGFESADFDSLNPQFSNERNTVLLQGSGLIELLAREMSADLKAIRARALKQARDTGKPVTAKLHSKGVSFGALTVRPDGMVDLAKIDGVDTDLVVRPFSQKGVFASLRQFTINAMNDHHGMQASERYGLRWTGSRDFDEDGVVDELTPGDISALVAFQATLPPPVRRAGLPPRWAEAAKRGEALFAEIGCASCHRPALPLRSLVFADPGPLDAAGTLRPGDVEKPIRIDLATRKWAASLPRNDKGEIMVPLFGDLKRHRIADKKNDRLGNELLGQRFVDRDVFITAELWGVGSTAPYGHRGDLTTLSEAIDAHGGEAAPVTGKWRALDATDRAAMIAFLRSLVIAP